ncbi:phage/plasmid primase, P4 family [Streptosporangium sp. NPDC051022]|uniref:phage/plasmid primase, P4 family n=1 Tax=Streptosporangium sp. NPDC051022 TaxID=3155752 RepID=UPI00341C0886
MNQLQQAAHHLHHAGLCVIPATTGKAPAVKWKRHTQAGGLEPRPTLEQLDAWFTSGRYDGLGVVCGAASGHLELFEFEGRAVRENIAHDYTALAEASGLGDLWRRVTTGYMEITPSGGIHLLYKVEGADARNAKLASRPATPEELAENPDHRIKVLIETRAEGGFVVVAPSAGRTHGDIPNGTWTLLAGGPTTIPTITSAERDALHHLAVGFDRMPHPDEQPPAPAAATPSSPLFSQPAPAFDDDSVSPGDDFNAKTTWDEILTPRGWKRIYTDSAGVTYWCRPGKSHGISATTGRNGADNLYVWTTSTEFEAERPYDRFGAHTLLTEGSTSPAALSAAATKLQARGYGVRVEPTVPAPAVQAPAVVGTLATVHELHPDGPPPVLRVVEERTYAQSDDGNALQLVDRFGDVIRYVPERGRWLAWDGTRWEWQPVGGGIVREYGKRVARGLDEADKTAIAHKRKALSALGTSSMLTQAQTDVRIVAAFDTLDAHPWELNTPSGIVDLTTGLLGPADATRLHTKVTSCSPDLTADKARWESFLVETFGNDLELIAYLQRLVGYSATGSVAKHVLPFCIGNGGNGKGVFLESLIGVLGDYATTAPSGFLMAKTSIQHETEIARLAGMRMVVCSEVDEDARFDETKVKHLTGGDSLTARFMRQDHFTFTATHHLWLMGNHQPAVRAGGRSFWRRLRLIPFLHEVPPEAVVDDLQGILARDHGPALLAWIIQGAAAYHSGGLNEPDSVMAATRGYEADQDTVARFVTECCHTAASDHIQIKITKLREAYERWCFVEGETPVSAKKLTQELARRFGVGQARSASSRSYTGITVLATEGEDPSSAPHLSQPDSDKIGGPGW